MSTKKKIIALAALLLLVVSVPTTVFLAQQQQDIRERASTAGGTTTVSLSPTTVSQAVNQSFPVNISFNTAGTAISAVAIRLSYPFSGTTPEITASNIQINPALPGLASGDWTCPVKSITTEGQSVKIDIACANTTISGFTSSASTLLATVNLKANIVPAANPTTLSFDPQKSVITKKSDGADILLTPTSSGTYTFTGGGGANPTPTPTPTSGANPTPTAIPTPVARTTTPTPIAGGGASAKAIAVKLTGLAPGQRFTSPRPTFTGTAAPNSRIDILIESNPITGTTVANASGHWSWTPSEDIEPGSHKLTVTATDPQGRVTTKTTTFSIGPATLPVTATTTPTLIISFVGMGLLLLGSMLAFAL